MEHWLHIETDDGFYRIDCSYITYVYYGGYQTLTFYLTNDQVSIEFNFRNCEKTNKYALYAKEICDFVSNGDENGNTLLIDIRGAKNTIKVIPNEKDTPSNNID